MKITTEQYTTLKLLADDVASARMAPKHLERFVKIVVQDDGKDKIVHKFNPDATRSAILVYMVQSVLIGLDPLAGFNVSVPASKKPVAVEDESQEHDVFTAEALAKIPPGKPDAATLAPPVSPKPGDKVISEFPRTDGREWQDEKGRYWKIIEGKKRQQKKPKA